MYANDSILSRGHDPNALFAFFHSQRSGGSAFVRWLNTVFDRTEVFDYRNVDPFIHWKRIDHTVLDGFKVWSGFSNFLELDLGRPVVALSTVRHPFYRIVSLYHMSIGHKRHFLHKLALKSSFEEYYRTAAAERPEYFHNMNCLRISNQPSADAAMDSMHRHFGLVGTTSRLPDMMARLAATYGWDFTSPEPVTSETTKYAAYLDSPAYDEIMENNTEDLRLFEHVNGLAESVVRDG